MTFQINYLMPKMYAKKLTEMNCMSQVANGVPLFMRDKEF